MTETEFARAERYWRETCTLTEQNKVLRQLLYEGSLIIQDHAPAYTVWLDKVEDLFKTFQQRSPYGKNQEERR